MTELFRYKRIVNIYGIWVAALVNGDEIAAISFGDTKLEAGQNLKRRLDDINQTSTDLGQTHAAQPLKAHNLDPDQHCNCDWDHRCHCELG